MSQINNHQKFIELRGKYQNFEFRNYSINYNSDNLEVEYLYIVDDSICFKPQIIIPYSSFNAQVSENKIDINSLVFNIGMIELISYWKSVCSPTVIIKPFKLTDDQINFWKKLYFNGLGEFFYLNGISTTEETFMSISSVGEELTYPKLDFSSQKVLVPIGGGKDSIVTIELLRKSEYEVVPLVLNPREASWRTIELCGCSIENTFTIERVLDKKIIELNEKGYLNGHTPFSALLAFYTLLASALSGIPYIALSNESSANESTVPGTKINHQYSKSYEFEYDFNNYVHKYISKDITYFSFLRPLNELQIAKIFSKFTWHFNSFRSCNVGSKTDSWCCECPKCLFTYIILSPFLSDAELRSIFGVNMLHSSGLDDIYHELIGFSEVKPFECVGTPEEVNAALGKLYPGNISVYQPLVNPSKNDKVFKGLLTNFNNENFLPAPFIKIIKDAIYD